MSGARIIGMHDGGLSRSIRPGAGVYSVKLLNTVATDANYTVTVSDLAKGLLQFTGFTAGRNLTTPTAAAIIAAYPQMDIGDAIELDVSITVAFAGTWVAGTGVTLAGRATTPASTVTKCYITKTAADAVTWTVF